MSDGVSDRDTDSFDNPAKTLYRQRHLDALRAQAPELWLDEERRRLLGGWLELVGATGWRTLELLEGTGAIEPEQFVGVDFEAPRIEDYRARFPRARWFAGNVLDLVNKPELDDVVVVHYDAYDAVGGRHADHVGEQFGALLRRAVEGYGAAALLWNTDLDAGRRLGWPAGASLRAHADRVCSVLRGALGPRRTLDPGVMVPPDAVAQANAGAVGMLGSFDVYRGKTAGHRMACLRLVLR
ncbi:MAG: hypothetical protein M9894_09830 [Planctomycetes bacterium]|nr:hypothetical protein [Planctomycetota bacterium]MCW8140083.1 hypothetical protein [Planctomycetota bacterium]